MIAYDYPLLGLMWTMFVFFLWFAWIMLLFRVIADIFRSDDMGGAAKAIWLLVVIFLPLIGVLVYVLSRGDGMTQRDIARAQAQQEQFASYVRQTASPAGGATDELVKLADLRDRGVITDAEFAAQKAKLLA
jgi:ABC-type Fe3+ transport system permease subunit